MGDLQARLFAPALNRRQGEQPLIVVGITHSQTCLVLRGRLRALREAGFRVALLCSPGPLLDRTAAEEGVDAIPIPIRRSFSPFSDLLSLARICVTLFRLRPAITEFSTPKAGLLGSIAALLCGVPQRVYLMRGLRLETASGWKRSILRMGEHLSAACSHVVLCNSRSLRRQIIAFGLAPADKVQVLGQGSSNGVDVEHFTPGAGHLKAACSIPADAPVIGFAGRLTRDKGIPELLEAFESILRTVPRARLLLVGWFDESDDALSPDLRAHIEQHSRIVHTGFVQDTAAWYRAMDLMVLPTWREGFPNAVLEAAASGVPVITTHATGARDSVLPEVTGLLVPPGDPNAIADAVLTLLADPGRRRRMGSTAREWVSECFPREQVQARAVALYRHMVADQAPAIARVFATDGFAAD
ncbi:MAG: glycosyltransferase family 4 protein [Acidobacteriota bacterium]